MKRVQVTQEGLRMGETGCRGYGVVISGEVGAVPSGKRFAK